MTFEGMTAIGYLHGFGAFAAVLLGSAMMLSAKGTARHRAMGKIYIPLMIAVNLSAFGLFKLTGGINVFHALAVLNLVTTLLGLRALVMWRRTGGGDWLRAHQIHMAYSYLGLMMAFVSELLTNPRFGIVDGFRSFASFWLAVAVLNAIMFWAGSRVIRRRIILAQA